jgi:hypothetical protein
MSKPMPLGHFLFGLNNGDIVVIKNVLGMVYTSKFTGYDWRNGELYLESGPNRLWWLGMDELDKLDLNSNQISPQGSHCFYPEP